RVLELERAGAQRAEQADREVPQAKHLRGVDGDVALGVDRRTEELQVVDGVRRDVVGASNAVRSRPGGKHCECKGAKAHRFGTLRPQILAHARPAASSSANEQAFITTASPTLSNIC